jgi:hypothetical protein
VAQPQSLKNKRSKEIKYVMGTKIKNEKKNGKGLETSLVIRSFKKV